MNKIREIIIGQHIVDYPGEPCPATDEAVREQEEHGEVGCPLCGRPPEHHEPEPI